MKYETFTVRINDRKEKTVIKEFTVEHCQIYSRGHRSFSYVSYIYQKKKKKKNVGVNFL